MKIFKLSFEKFLLALVLFILFVPFISYDTGIRCITVPCPSETTGSLAQYLFHNTVPVLYDIKFSALVIGLICSYAVSSLVILYFKRRQKSSTEI